MGQLAIDVKSLEDRQLIGGGTCSSPSPRSPKKKEEDTEKKLGKLELAIRWKHNPDIDPAPRGVPPG